MHISPIDLAKKDHTKRLILYVNKFLLSDAPDAVHELELLHRPTAGNIYKALYDTNTEIYYLDIPEALEINGGGWAFSGLSPTESNGQIDYELIEITKENTLDLDLNDLQIETLADWLEEDPLKFSWENEESLNKVPTSREEWEKKLLGENPVDGLDNALDILEVTNPQLYSSLSLVVIMLALQEQGLLPKISSMENIITNKANVHGVPIAIGALIDSHVNRSSVPNMVGVVKLSLLEIARLVETGLENFIAQVTKANK